MGREPTVGPVEMVETLKLQAVKKLEYLKQKKS